MKMKKTMMIAVLILVAAAACFAETHTITLVSRMEKQDPQFVIRNNGCFLQRDLADKRRAGSGSLRGKSHPYSYSTLIKKRELG